jgi:hypothetical protein
VALYDEIALLTVLSKLSTMEPTKAPAVAPA